MKYSYCVRIIRCSRIHYQGLNMLKNAIVVK